MERNDGKLVIVGWLRSPLAGEVNATGNELDRRHETVSVRVPCTEIGAPATYSVTGGRVPNRARFLPGEVQEIPLTGTGVFIATFDCRRD